jgi:hypothetical protein
LAFSGATEARDRIDEWQRENGKEWNERPKLEAGRCGRVVSVLMVLIYISSRHLAEAVSEPSQKRNITTPVN